MILNSMGILYIEISLVNKNFQEKEDKYRTNKPLKNRT